MFDELSEDEIETTSSSEVLAPGAADDAVDASGVPPVTPDWREEKIGVGPVEVCPVRYIHAIQLKKMCKCVWIMLFVFVVPTLISEIVLSEKSIILRGSRQPAMSHAYQSIGQEHFTKYGILSFVGAVGLSGGMSVATKQQNMKHCKH